MKNQMAHTIVIFRHGETMWNRQDRYQGKMDIEISEIGEQQAKQNGVWLKKFCTENKIDKVNYITSPLIRAQKSLDIIIETCRVEAKQRKVVNELEEIGMGRWQGLNNLEVKEQFYQERKNRKINKWTFKPENGESLEDRMDEVAEQMRKLTEVSVVVAHAGIIKIIQHCIGGITTQDAADFNMPHVGALVWRNDRLIIMRA